MHYIVHLAILCAVYVVAVWSLDVLIGRLGVFSLAQAAFVGVGAYGYALARIRLEFGALGSLAVAVVASCAFAVIAAIPARQLAGERAMLYTIAIQGITTILLFNLEDVTGGAFGIGGIKPVIELQGGPTIAAPAITAAIVALSGALFFSRFHRSGASLLIRAVGESESLASTVGVNVSRTRIAAYVNSGASAGVVGAFLAGYMTFIDPNSFNLDESIFLITALLVGGSANLLGPALGVALVLLVPELLRGISVSPAIAGNVQQITFAVLLIVLMRMRPQGLAGETALR
jgi:branched-chain amino acid transport system permease protein